MNALPDPPARPLSDGRPYRVERAVLQGIPGLLELPPEGEEVTALCLVYHGAWAAKEGKLGVYSAPATRGVAVVLTDAACHGERQGETPPGLGARDYVWESVRRTVAEAPALIDALTERFGALPVLAVGSSMGGYVVQALLQTEPRLTRAAALITSGVWDEPLVERAECRAFIEAHRPVTQAGHFPLRPLYLGSGAQDPVFPTAHHQRTAEAYRQAASSPELFREEVFEGVGHYTSSRMRDAAVHFLLQGQGAAHEADLS